MTVSDMAHSYVGDLIAQRIIEDVHTSVVSKSSCPSRQPGHPVALTLTIVFYHHAINSSSNVSASGDFWPEIKSLVQIKSNLKITPMMKYVRSDQKCISRALSPFPSTVGSWRLQGRRAWQRAGRRARRSHPVPPSVLCVSGGNRRCVFPPWLGQDIFFRLVRGRGSNLFQNAGTTATHGRRFLVRASNQSAVPSQFLTLGFTMLPSSIIGHWIAKSG